MAAVASFYLLILLLYVATAQRQRNISIGSSLTPSGNSVWLSSSGLYGFGFYNRSQHNDHGVGVFLAGIPDKTVVWTPNRDSFPTDTVLNLTSNEGLILQPGGANWLSIITTSGPASSAAMLDTGNFVLYGSDGKTVWQSFDNPSDTILPGQRLGNGKQLVSSSGRFRLKMQTDGHLVQYPVGTSDTAEHSYWASGTNGWGNNVTLRLDTDARLYLTNSTIDIRNLTNGGYPEKGSLYLTRIDSDGIFRLYTYVFSKNESWSIIWNSSNDKCDPKGLCGFNGYCNNRADYGIECLCLTGYDFVDSGNQSLGCERSFALRSCKEKEGKLEMGSTMTEVSNMVWLENPYETVTVSKEECQKACLEDCDCEIALFNERQCRKQRLPLIYGRRKIDSSDVALVKVGLSSYYTSPNNFLAEKNNKESSPKVLIIGISLIASAFIVVVIATFLMYRKHVWAYKKISETRDAELCKGIAPRSFTYKELVEITSDFKEEVGRGAFGTVFMGKLAGNQRAVAVKKLENVSVEGEREFQNEMRVIGKTHHRNLVRLIGYCSDGPNRLLVYDYMSNGSLANVLFTPEKRPSWDDRISIALDIAKGILYLHEECETQIIHCDIKPQNILMDDRGCAKLSDFGLSKLLKADQTKTDTGIRGTKGYVAPEWHRKASISVKADVYSFGIVIMEIISCRKSVDWSLPEDEAILEEWVYNCFEAGESYKLVKDDNIEKKKVEKFVKIALWCIQDDPSLRPSIKKVMLMLEGTVEIPIPPRPTSFLSTM